MAEFFDLTFLGAGLGTTFSTSRQPAGRHLLRRLPVRALLAGQPRAVQGCTGSPSR
ncbi:hypothetical protein G5V59_14910 [Nocardioides sp. W3-2-3]|nr:hypothetical protein [Nocardioides convexus]